LILLRIEGFFTIGDASAAWICTPSRYTLSLRNNHASGSASKARRWSFMAQPTLFPSGYYIRRKVPAELRPFLGREYKRSLKTRDPAEAKARFAEHWSESELAFARARAQAAGEDVMKPGDAEQLAARWFREEQERLWRTGAFTDMLAEDSVATHETVHGPEEHPLYATLRRYVEHDPDLDWPSIVHPCIERTMRQHALPMPARDTAAYSRLLAAFGDHVERLSQWALDCHEGKPDTHSAIVAPRVPIHAELKASEARPASGRTHTGKPRTLRDLFTEYSTRKKLNDGDNRSTQKTLAEFGAGINDFVELHGNPELSALGRDLIAGYRAALAKLPRKGRGTRQMTAPQLIARAEAEGMTRISEQTIRNRLRALSAVLSCGVELGWLHENPVIAGGFAKAAARAAAKRQAGSSRRKHYTHGELAAILSSDAFTDSQWTPPRADFGRAWYWLPLLLYYTGARREELAQLAVADVRRDADAGCWFLSILEVDDPDGGRTVKTAGSRRRIPIHPDMIERGFLDYVQSLPSDGPVFPKLQPDRHGFLGTNIGKRWAAYLRDTLKLESPASPSHGFRHTFKTLCREVGIPEDVHDAITGHVGGSAVARGYGTMPLSRMAEELKRFPSAPLGQSGRTGGGKKPGV
jgi:integrase